MTSIRRLLLAVTLLAVACAPAAPAVATASAAPVATSTARQSSAPPTTVANPSPTIALGTVTVQMAEHFYTPSFVTVAVGTTVVWVVVGQQPHDVHARDGSFNSPLMGPGNTFKVTFTKAGKFPYFCAPHEGDGMFGEVDVGAN